MEQISSLEETNKLADNLLERMDIFLNKLKEHSTNEANRSTNTTQ